MTATERVSTNIAVTGAKKVSGLSLKGWVTRVITMTTRKIYPAALRALMRGFFDITLLYTIGTSNSMKDILALHIIRVVTIWSIVIFHGSILIQDKLGITTPFYFLKFLYSGVDVLFVLSGFLLYYNYLSKFQTSNFSYALRFLKKRLIRIVPIYYVLTIGLIVVHSIEPSVGSEMDYSLVGVIKSLLIWPAYFPIIEVGWILSYLLFFYALFSLLFIPKLRWIFWAVVSLSLILIFKKPNPFLFNYFNIEFLLGMASGYCYFNFKKIDKSLLLSLGLSIFFGAGALDIISGNIFHREFRVITYGVASFFLIWGMARWKIAPSKWITTSIKSLSKSSYALFLSHFSILEFLSLIFLREIMPLALSWIVMTTLTIITGHLIYLYIEEPLTLTIRKRF